MPQYPETVLYTLCCACHWPVPLRRKSEGLLGSKVTGYPHISSVIEWRLPEVIWRWVTLQMCEVYVGISNHWFIQQSHYTIVKVNITFHSSGRIIQSQRPSFGLIRHTHTKVDSLNVRTQKRGQLQTSKIRFVWKSASSKYKDDGKQQKSHFEFNLRKKKQFKNTPCDPKVLELYHAMSESYHFHSWSSLITQS